MGECLTKRKTMSSDKIDPHTYFSGWHFDIRPELWPALGVTRRAFVDKAKTKVLREAARKAGHEDPSRLKITYFAYAVDDPPALAFEEGDVFYAKRSNSSIQVGKIKELTEVWVRSGAPTHACRLAADELATWLQTGKEPPGKRIHRFESWSEIATYHILKT